MTQQFFIPCRRAAVFAGLLGFLILSGTPLRGDSRPPNLVVIFIDDLGWGDFSCFGNRNAETPAIDRLAREGLVFEQFYVNSPICSPSRVAISTGTYPQRWDITSYLAHRRQNEKRGMAQWLDPAAPMLARRLQKAGYATGHFGKWHMGGQRDVREAPPITAYGFDESLTNFEGTGAKLLPMTREPNGREGRIWADAEILGGPVVWMQRSEITSGFVNAALAFIRRAEIDDKPFYVNIWPDDVHTPLWPPVEAWGKGDPPSRYRGVLEAMDRQLAPLFDELRSNERLRARTLVLLCSDNGPEKGLGSAGPFKGYKTQLYEGGVRSPLIVWGPGLVDPEAVGTRNRASVFSAIDLAPSLAEIVGLPVEEAVLCDGEALGDTLLGRSRASRAAPLFFSRPPDRKEFYGMKDLPDLAVRRGKWKLLCDEDGSDRQLYDLSVDPGETSNLAEREPELADELSVLVREWFAGVTADD